MAITPFIVDVDFKIRIKQPTPIMTQHDTETRLTVKVSDNGDMSPSILDDFVNITLASKRPDGTVVHALGTKVVDTSNVEFMLTNGELNSFGFVEASVQFYTIEPERVSTLKFKYEVEQDLSDEYTLNAGDAVFLQELLDDTRRVTTELENTIASTVKHVNVKAFGAIGDGVADDTEAIFRAFENSLGLGVGEFETLGQTAAEWDYNTTPVYFPAGKYRVTRTIPINYARVSLIGEEGSSIGLGASTILADHAGDVFHIYTDFISHEFAMKSMGITKTITYRGQGHGIATSGTEWSTGFFLTSCSIRYCSNGINLSNGSSTQGHFFINMCTINNNLNYGIYSTENLTIGDISQCSITQNGAGISVGAHGFSIFDNDFEGQNSPLTITHTGNSTDITIFGNYFEYHQEGEACIVMNGVSKFKITGNFFSVNVPIPDILLRNCSNGEVDRTRVVMENCFNIKSEGSFDLETCIQHNNDRFNDNFSSYQPQSSIILGTSDASFKYRGVLVPANAVDALARLSYGAMLTINAGDSVFVSYAVKYTGDVPGEAYGFSAPGILPQLRVVSTGAFITLGYVGANLPVGEYAVGDTIVYTFRFEAPEAATQLNVYTYIYGSATTDTGSGALISTPVVWLQPTSNTRNVNPLEILINQ